MVNAVQAVSPSPVSFPTLSAAAAGVSSGARLIQRDTVEFGLNVQLTAAQSIEIVVERSIEKLRAVVAEARAELGIPEDAVLDTSPEATAGRIVDFALAAFNAYAENHSEAEGEALRRQFVDFIGGAIAQGIEEARSILGALQALTPEIDTNINNTFEIIQARLEDFAANG